MVPLIFLILLILSSSGYSQTYQLDVDSIPVDQNGWLLQQPWTGGINNSDPHLIDIDADGDLDFMISEGNWGNIFMFENEGDPFNPEFKFVTRGILDTTMVFAITFGDLDDDGDYDFLGGTSTGLIKYYENIGNSVSPIFELADDSVGNIDVGYRSTPYIVDIDNDGDLDLFIGKGGSTASNSGRISYYINDGAPELFDFILVTDFFDSIDVGFNSRPVFNDIDCDEDLDLFIGNSNGHIWFFRNTGIPEIHNFMLEDTMYVGMNIPDYRTFPCFGDIDGDTDQDLFIGTGDGVEGDYGDMGGQIYFYENTGDSINFDFQLVCGNYLSLDIGTQSAPALGQLFQEGIYDLYTGQGKGKTFFYRNTGTYQLASFDYDSTVFSDITVTYMSKPVFCDIDNDGDQDLFLGREIMTPPTCVYFYRNIGSIGNPQLVLESEIIPGYGGITSPALVDIDNDSDLDLFIGWELGGITFYKNTGTPEQFRFQWMTNAYSSIDIGWWANPTFCDIDDDGDPDLFIGNTSGDLFFYENIGTADSAVFDSITNEYIDLDEYGPISETTPFFVDIDNDNDFDFFCGCGNGGIVFYRNLGDSHVTDFQREFGLNDYKLFQNYPNPFNSSTTVTFSLPTTSQIEIAVYDNLGRKVMTLIKGLQSIGLNKVEWNAGGLSSGIYYISLEGSEIERQTRKVILVK